MHHGRLGLRRQPRRQGGRGRTRGRPREEAEAAVAELRAGADRSTGLVREFTGLVAAEHTAPVLVVDRRGWVQANADGFAKIIEPMIDKLSAKKGAAVGARRWRSARASPAPRSGCCSASSAPRCSASSTRSTTRRAGCCSWRPTSSTSSASSASTRRLPALGLPARGDAPGAVHGRAVDARPPLRRDDGARPTPSSPPRSPRTASRAHLRGRPRRRRQPDRRDRARPSSARSSTGSPA